MIKQILIGMSLLTAASTAMAGDIEEGKQIAYDRKKGNCLTCHMMDDGQQTGNFGPPLIAMKARYPEFEKLRAQIFDPTVRNPNTSMPPFGRHGILTEEEIDKVTKYVHSL